MRVDRPIAIVACGALALIAWSQSSTPKAGLYEVSNRMTWQKSPFPDGMQDPAGSSGVHTGQTCITQAQIDKYNGPKPEANGGCQITHIQKLKNGMTAEISCSGSMKGKGSVESKWIDSSHSNSKVHFAGEMQVGQNAHAVEWTIESESTYKGPDCGGIKPSTPD